VCAYSTRARGSGRQRPVGWDELAGLDPAAFDIRSVPQGLTALKGDPWDGCERARRRLAPEMFAAVGIVTP